MLELLGYIVLVFSFIGLIYALGVAFGECVLGKTANALGVTVHLRCLRVLMR
jgi:hypothetical protein